MLWTCFYQGHSDCKESACNTGDLGSISGSRRSSGEENVYPLQYSCLENHGQRNLTVLGIASLAAQLIKNLPSLQETWFNSWVRKIPWRKDRLPTPIFLGLPGGSTSKESACNVGDLGSIPGLGRSLGEGICYPLQYSGLENSMDYTVHEVAKSWIQLSDFHYKWYHMVFIFLSDLLYSVWQSLYPSML